MNYRKVKLEEATAKVSPESVLKQPMNWPPVGSKISNRIEMPNEQIIKSNQDEAYKYVSILQLGKIKHGLVKMWLMKNPSKKWAKC